MNFDGFKKILDEAEIRKIVFVGLGNEYRGDDSAGILLLNSLKNISFLSKAVFINAASNPENYLEKILTHEPDMIIFIDAARFGGRPGEISLLENDFANSVSISTHAFSIKMIEEYLSAHRKIKFLYIAIQPLNTGFGTETSEEVLASINQFISTFGG